MGEPAPKGEEIAIHQRMPQRSRDEFRPSFKPDAIPRQPGEQESPWAFGSPAASCAKIESTRVSHHRLAETIRHSLRDGFTTYSALSPAIGLFCRRPRAMQSIVASSRQRRGVKTTRLCRPRGKRIRRVRSPTAIASRASVRDDRDTPPLGGHMGHAWKVTFLRFARHRKQSMPAGGINATGQIRLPRAKWCQG